jgi:hypothetical protein
MARHRMPDRASADSGISDMTADGDSVSKHAAPMPGYLCEQMTVQRLTEVLAALPFNSHEEAKVVLDPGVQTFLIAAAKAAAADHLDVKVRHVWRSIRPPR